MKLKLRYNLYRAKRNLNPSNQFKRELSASLSKKFDEIYGRPGIWYRYIWVRTTRVILASTVGVSVVSTSAFAYNSPQVTEGSVLYPIKISIEKIEEKTKVTTESKVKFLLKKAERREAEREVLIERFNTEVKKPIVSNNFPVVSSTLTTSTPEVVVSTSTTSSVAVIEDEGRGREGEFTNREGQNFSRNDNNISREIKKDVEMTNRKIEDVDHSLEAVKSKLKDNEEGKKLKQIIDSRLEKHKTREKVKINSSNLPATSSTVPVNQQTSTQRDLEIKNREIRLRIIRDQKLLEERRGRESSRRESEQRFLAPVQQTTSSAIRIITTSTIIKVEDDSDKRINSSTTIVVTTTPNSLVKIPTSTSDEIKTESKVTSSSISTSTSSGNSSGGSGSSSDSSSSSGGSSGGHGSDD